MNYFLHHYSWVLNWCSFPPSSTIKIPLILNSLTITSGDCAILPGSKTWTFIPEGSEPLAITPFFHGSCYTCLFKVKWSSGTSRSAQSSHWSSTDFPPGPNYVKAILIHLMDQGQLPLPEWCKQKLVPVNKKCKVGPSQLAQLVRSSSQYAKVAGSIPGQGAYKINQWMHK